MEPMVAPMGVTPAITGDASSLAVVHSSAQRRLGLRLRPGGPSVRLNMPRMFKDRAGHDPTWRSSAGVTANLGQRTSKVSAYGHCGRGDGGFEASNQSLRLWARPCR